MAAFAIVDYHTGPGTVANVIAAMETYLETKDSTTNVIYFIGVLPLGGETVDGVIIHAG